MAFEPLVMDAARICDGLSRIGYTPPAAITDIMDNAVTAEATTVTVLIVRENKARGDSRRDNVREYLIIDNGRGMSKAEIKSALALGSADLHYSPATLSKFGLGLKSASFSQGETLEVISSSGSGMPFAKYRVSLPEIRERGEYGAEDLDLSDDDEQIVNNHLSDGHGTIIRITDIRKNNHPAIKSTVDELQQRVGVIYFYFMRDGMQINIDGALCSPLDALFSDDANTNGNLDENDWNGRETRWIQRPIEIVLDAERNVKATVEVTQLPHPPTFKFDGEGKPAEVRDYFRIDAGNYGFYVYRNKRLLSWAERFSGPGKPIVPQDNDFYAFRGRILLGADADDVINLDVKKSHVMLSDEAFKALGDVAAAYRRKSKRAWKYAGEQVTAREEADSVGAANRLANQAETPEDLPGIPEDDASLAEQKKREDEILAEQSARFAQEAANLARLETELDDEPNTTLTDPLTVVQGEDAKPTDRVFRVRQVEDHALYEPYYDATKKGCVRINRTHRFAQLIYQDNSGNGALQILFDLMLLKFSDAEMFAERHLQQFDRRTVEFILKAYRRYASEFLAQMCRDLADELPHSE